MVATVLGTAGRIHIDNDRARRYPDLYAQDRPVRGSVACRVGRAVNYIGPFGLWLFARDVERDMRERGL